MICRREGEEWRERGEGSGGCSSGGECLLRFDFSFGGYLVLYVDKEQGSTRRLDNAAESPLGHALPRHIP